MVKFLLHRPIAVIMTWSAIIILGIVCCVRTPLSLLPDIPIPNIFIEITAPEKTGEEIEHTIVAPILRQLMQVEGFNEVKSTVNHGKAHITLSLDYGIDTDYTFLETNERLDAIRSQLPVAGVSIRTAKAKATDLPVMLIQVTENSSDVSRSDKRQMSDVVDNVVRRRLEQLPDVSMVDITGTVQPQISLYPDLQRLSQCNLTVADLMQALSRAGSANSTVRVIDGGRVCHLTVNNSLTSADDVARTPLFSLSLIHI